MGPSAIFTAAVDVINRREAAEKRREKAMRGFVAAQDKLVQWSQKKLEPHFASLLALPQDDGKKFRLETVKIPMNEESFSGRDMRFKSGPEIELTLSYMTDEEYEQFTAPDVEEVEDIKAEAESEADDADADAEVAVEAVDVDEAEKENDGDATEIDKTEKGEDDEKEAEAEKPARYMVIRVRTNVHNGFPESYNVMRGDKALTAAHHNNPNPVSYYSVKELFHGVGIWLADITPERSEDYKKANPYNVDTIRKLMRSAWKHLPF